MIGSDLADGQIPLVGFFRLFQPLCSPFTVGVSPLVIGDVAGIWKEVAVEEADELDDTDDEELVLCALFLGMNILVTSSALILFRPPCPVLFVFHCILGRG